MARHPVLFSLVALASVEVAQAACPVDAARVASAVDAFHARQAQQPLLLPADEALCFRQAFVAELSARLGPPVGYKVGLYTKAGQKTFAYDKPVIGVLLRDMILEDAPVVPATLGYAPIAEADFVLVVGDERINAAKSREEAYRYLRAYRPFIEFPDNNYPPGTPVSAGQLIALNVNARMGVLGPEIPLSQTPDGLAGLANLSVVSTIEGPAGAKQAEAKAVDSLGDPLSITLSARDELLLEGGRLRPGDLISIGTITPPHSPSAGERMHVEYRLGKETAEISIRFGP